MHPLQLVIEAAATGSVEAVRRALVECQCTAATIAPDEHSYVIAALGATNDAQRRAPASFPDVSVRQDKRDQRRGQNAKQQRLEQASQLRSGRQLDEHGRGLA